MAKMIPDNVVHEEFHGSYGEEYVYKALQLLPKEYIIFHSVHWQRKNQNANILWGESDFTIFHPERGLLVVEVKSGGIRFENGRWLQINTLTDEIYNMKDPLLQAERSKFTFIDLISSISGIKNNYWIEAAVWFPSIDNKDSLGDLPPAYTTGNVLTMTDMTNPLASIERVFDYYNMYKRDSYHTEDINRIISVLSPKFDAIPSMASKINEQKTAFNRMTKEQSYLLDYLEEQKVAVIQGGAGTGKTMLAIEKAKRLSKNDKTLFLCFNRLLLEYLINSYSAELPNVDFYNLQRLVCNRKGSIEAGGDEGISEYLNSYYSYEWEYKNIIIDEGQDILEEHIELLYEITEMNKGCFYIFYDKNQLVQQRQSLEWVNSVECRLILTANCRNTKCIATTSYSPIGIENVKMKIEVKGNKPSFYIEKSQQKAIERIAKLIRHYTDSGLQKSEIVLLTAKTVETSILSGIRNLGSYQINNESNTNGIFFTSARKFKGLESSVIIMTDVDDNNFVNDEERRVFYVGASRAKHYLDLISVLDEKQISNMAFGLIGQKKKNPKLTISTYMKVKIVME